MVNLLIDGYSLETPKNGLLQISLNRQLTDQDDPTSRRGDYSFTVAIPKTPGNDAIFGYRGHTNFSRRFVNDRQFNAQVLVDGATVLNGSFKLTEVTKTEFRGTLTAGVSALAGSLNGSIRDLTMTEVPFNGPISYGAFNQGDTINPFGITLFESWDLADKKPWNGPYPIWFPLIVGGEFLRKDSELRRSPLITSTYNNATDVAYATQSVYSDQLPQDAINGAFYRVAAPTETSDIDDNNAGGGHLENHVILSWSTQRLYYGDGGRWNDLGFAHNVLDWRAFKPGVFVKDILISMFDNIGYKLEGEIFNDETFRRLNIVDPSGDDGMNWKNLGKCWAYCNNVRPIDQLTIFKSSFANGDTRQSSENPNFLFAKLENGAHSARRPYISMHQGASLRYEDNDFTYDGSRTTFTTPNYTDTTGITRSDKNDNDDRFNPVRYCSIRLNFDRVRWDFAQSFSDWKSPSDILPYQGDNKLRTVESSTSGVTPTSRRDQVYGNNGDNVGSEWRCPRDGRYLIRYGVNFDHLNGRHANNHSNDRPFIQKAYLALTLGDNTDDFSQLCDHITDQKNGTATDFYDEAILGWQRLIPTAGIGTSYPENGTGSFKYTAGGAAAWSSQGDTSAGSYYEYTGTNGKVYVTVEADFKQGDLVRPWIIMPLEPSWRDGTSGGDGFWNSLQRYTLGVVGEDSVFGDTVFSVLPQFGERMLQPAKCLPDIGQKEFLKSILVAFNQFISVDSDNRIVTLTPRSRFYFPFADALDITDRVVVDSFDAVPNEGPKSVSFGFNQWADDISQVVSPSQPVLDIEGDNIYAGDPISYIFPYYKTVDALFNNPFGTQKIKFPFAAKAESWNLKQNDPNLQWPAQPGPRLLLAGQNVGGVLRAWTDYGDGFGLVSYAVNGPTDNLYTFPLAESSNSVSGGWNPYTDILSQFWADYQLFAGLEIIEFDAYLTPAHWQAMRLERPVRIDSDTYYLHSIQGYDPTGKSAAKVKLLRP